MNQRKQNAALVLRRNTDEELKRKLQSVKRDYRKARRMGYCSYKAVLYFDVQQIKDEIERRKTK